MSTFVALSSNQHNNIIINRRYECSIGSVFDEVAEYDRLDNIFFSDLIEACRQNPKVKKLSKTREFTTQRLNFYRYYVSIITKASYILLYLPLKQKNSKSGAEFVDREMREYLALRDFGINIRPNSYIKIQSTVIVNGLLRRYILCVI